MQFSGLQFMFVTTFLRIQIGYLVLLSVIWLSFACVGNNIINWVGNFTFFKCDLLYEDAELKMFIMLAVLCSDPRFEKLTLMGVLC